MAVEQEYQVVARRYRPQNFGELIGQEHIAKALANAIQNNRIGHAYLFTGARGVGKTSSARIFAKSLNCVNGPTATPCNVCEICQGITAGEDLDVIEIDGASNRGIDQIRTLIQNVNVRPVRARFKIYIIDEVHMLTNEAFNALLKTLEEPPEHVKFIFCTTEVNKIPITILSRCQRFDFAGIGTLAIANRLQAIVTNEGLTAEPEAIRLLARRANGSMRDGQSLLEQLLAFTSGTITLQDVHQLLGTANDEVLVEILRSIGKNEPSAILRLLDAMLQQGTDPGQLLEQLFGCLRDLMAILAGCGSESFLFLPTDWEEEATQLANQMGLEMVLAAMQITDHTLTRMKISTQGRLLAEMAFVRICALQNLDDLATLVTKIQAERQPGTEENSVKTGNSPISTPSPVSTPSPAQNSARNPTPYDGPKPSIPSPAFPPHKIPAGGAMHGGIPVGNVQKEPEVSKTETVPEPLTPPAGVVRSFTEELATHITEDYPPFDYPVDDYPVVDMRKPQKVSQEPVSKAVTQPTGLSLREEIIHLRNAFMSALENFSGAQWYPSFTTPKDTILSENRQEFTVIYPHKCEFPFQQFTRNTNDVQSLESVFRAKVGRPNIRLRFILEENTETSRKPQGVGFREMYENPLVHAAEELFGASIMSVEPIGQKTGQ